VPHQPWPRQSVGFASFFFAYYAFIGVFAPYASLYFAARGMSAAQIGVLMSLIQVMRIFGPNLWGWVADRSGRRMLVLRITAWAGCIAFLGFFFGRDFTTLFALMLLLNLFSSAQAPLSEALLVSEMRGDLTHYGRLRLWGSVGFIVAVTLAGQILDAYGVTVMPWIALLTLVLTGVTTLCLHEAPHAAHAKDAPSISALLRLREVRAFFASTFMMLAAHGAIYVFYSLYLEQLGYSNTVIGLMWSLGVLAEIVFFFYQAPIFRRFSLRSLMLVSLLLASVRFVMIGLGAQSLFLLVLAQLLHAATFGVHNSAAVASMQRWFGGPLQARGQALYFSISYGLGGAFGGLILSLAWNELGARAVFLLAAVFAALGMLAASFSYRWQDSDRPHGR
jgi:PPP family 3-phenylpropionic acid transporter